MRPRVRTLKEETRWERSWSRTDLLTEHTGRKKTSDKGRRVGVGVEASR